jgi:hypothetical protein
MTKFERRLFFAINIAISIVGIIYFIYKFYFKVETDFGLRPHPATSFWLHFHIISVPLLIFSVGSLYKSHIYPKLKVGNAKRKISGISIFALFILMSVSGYLLEMAFESNSVIGIVHITVSFLWIIGYLWHFRLRI